ncbi:hypothetical protein SNEBB_004154 [Seison nebaliae]|nr:hypothetical protein SNEBB_004154 [Seison nebaliae]
MNKTSKSRNSEIQTLKSRKHCMNAFMLQIEHFPSQFLNSKSIWFAFLNSIRSAMLYPAPIKAYRIIGLKCFFVR